MAIHPGEILQQEFILPYGLTPSALASRLGLAANRVTTIVNGERSVSPEMAVLLGLTFNTSADFWLNLQRHYDLEQARKNMSPDRVARAHALHRDLVT